MHLRDQLLDARKPPLAAQAGDERDPQRLAVEVALEVDQVGLDQQARARSRRSADAHVDRRGLAVGERRIDAVPGGDADRRRARGSRSGSRASAPARRPRRPSPSSRKGAPRQPVGDARPRPRRSASGCGSRRRSRRRPRPAAPPASRTPGATASISGSPFALAPKRKFSPTDTCSAPERLDQDPAAELLGGMLGELVIERDHDQLLDPEALDHVALDRRTA